jgi:hypothetical protein
VFVGLSCLDRHACEPDSEYQLLAGKMIADWESRFAAEPLRAAIVSDYLGPICRDKDEE